MFQDKRYLPPLLIFMIITLGEEHKSLSLLYLLLTFLLKYSYRLSYRAFIGYYPLLFLAILFQLFAHLPQVFLGNFHPFFSMIFYQISLLYLAISLNQLLNDSDIHAILSSYLWPWRERRWLANFSISMLLMRYYLYHIPILWQKRHEAMQLRAAKRLKIAEYQQLLLLLFSDLFHYPKQLNQALLLHGYEEKISKKSYPKRAWEFLFFLAVYSILIYSFLFFSCKV